jgi:hypothetical protein
MARRVLWIVILVVWFAVAGYMIYWLQDRQIRRLEYARPYRDSLALPQIVDRDRADSDPAEEELPQLAEVMALGYDDMVASVLWLRVIQAFGAKLQHVRENPRELRAIENLFLVITELDPRFIEAYKFGNFVIGEEGRDQMAALRLLDRGIVRNYKRGFILPYEAVFICLHDLKNYKLALYYIRLALRSPDCPDYVKRTENHIALKRGNYEIALERWIRDDIEATLNRQKYVLQLSRMQLNIITNQWHNSIIEAAMDRYFERHQDYPARLEQLKDEDLIGAVRQVDGPRLMQLLDGVEAAGIPPNVAVDMVIGTKGRPGGIIESDRIPRDLRGEPYLLLDDTTIPRQKRPGVAEREGTRKKTLPGLLAIRRRIEDYHKTNGRYPAALADLPEMQPGSRERLEVEDPAGMPWKYDPATGKVSSYVFPEL